MSINKGTSENFSLNFNSEMGKSIKYFKPSLLF